VELCPLTLIPSAWISNVKGPAASRRMTRKYPQTWARLTGDYSVDGQRRMLPRDEPCRAPGRRLPWNADASHLLARRQPRPHRIPLTHDGARARSCGERGRTPSPLPQAEGAQCSEDNQARTRSNRFTEDRRSERTRGLGRRGVPGRFGCTVRPVGFAQFGCTVRTTDTDAAWLPCRALGAGLSKPEQMGVGVPLP
jgi:hypothetical protein